MRVSLRFAGAALTAGALLAGAPRTGRAQAGAASAAPAASARDGQHDFDFLFGQPWKVELRRLQHPLSGDTTWVRYSGTARTTALWDGRANITDFRVERMDHQGGITGAMLRLYNPATREWSFYWANAAAGTLTLPPTVGRFQDGRGVFLDKEDLDGRPIVARYIWTNATPTTTHFEQSYSADDGKTWEVNWVADLSRPSP